MCGIVAGVAGRGRCSPVFLQGVENALEYRGYDSCGVAVVRNGEIDRARSVARVKDLAEQVQAEGMQGTVGIAHTRWATHGAPTDKNSHPHRDCSGRIAIVHNGIIENFRELRGYLQKNGHTLVSDTDSEVVAHLIEDAWAGPCKGDLVAAVRNAVRRLEGSWALAVVCADARARSSAPAMGLRSSWRRPRAAPMPPPTSRRSRA